MGGGILYLMWLANDFIYILDCSSKYTFTNEWVPTIFFSDYGVRIASESLDGVHGSSPTPFTAAPT